MFLNWNIMAQEETASSSWCGIKTLQLLLKHSLPLASLFIIFFLLQVDVYIWCDSYLQCLLLFIPSTGSNLYCIVTNGSISSTLLFNVASIQLLNCTKL